MLGLFRKLLPREDRFFDLFADHSRTVMGAAEALNALLAGGPDIESHCDRIVALENEADEITREVLLAVRRSFITPFDRGDIKDLIQSMDDAIDMMHKTVKTIRLYEQKSFDPGMQAMGAAVVEAALLTREAVGLMANMRQNVTRLNQLTEQITHIEDRSDGIYDAGRKALFMAHRHADPMAFIVGVDIYSHLEKVMDRFEDVANRISGIVIEQV